MNTQTKVVLAVLALICTTNVTQAADTSAGPPPEAWRDVNPENLVLIDVKYGQIVIELSPWSAPAHVARLKALVRAHFYDGLSFYRVIDGFVAQAGIGEGTAATAARPITPAVRAAWPPLKREFDVAIDRQIVFTPLGSPDLFAPEVGHIDGFPAGRDAAEKRLWMVNCYGTVGFARDNEPDTATTEFYIIIGQVPHRLDRNLSMVGRVIDGMQYVQKLERGDPNVESGVIQEAGRADTITRATVAADLPAAQRPHYQVIRTDSAAYAAMKEERRVITNPFFYRHPPEILDVCLMPIPVRKVAQ
jgi:peptidylprolyl isomerase